MKALQNIQVLLVGRTLSSADLLTVWLRSEGASLSTSGWETAREALALGRAAVVVMEVGEDVVAAHELLAAMREELSAQELPAIALVVASSSSAVAPPVSGAARFQKYLTLPVHPVDLVSAIAGLCAPRPSAVLPSEPATAKAAVPPKPDALATMFEACAQRKDMRGALALLNSTGPFRFTSVLRIDGERLVSVWTYDRQGPDADEFPVDATVGASYCALVQQTREPVTVTDASQDPRLEGHPKRHEVLSYCGVPLFGSDGALYGTLCHYDVLSRVIVGSTQKRLEAAAQILRAHLSIALADESVPRMVTG